MDKNASTGILFRSYVIPGLHDEAGLVSAHQTSFIM